MLEQFAGGDLKHSFPSGAQALKFSATFPAEFGCRLWPRDRAESHEEEHRRRCGPGKGPFRFVLRGDSARSPLSGRQPGLIRFWKMLSNQSVLTVPHGACGTTAPKILVDAVVQRVDELLGRGWSAFRSGRVIQFGQFRAPTAQARPQDRSSLFELLQRQELERCLATSNREKGHPVAPCVTSIRTTHDVDNLEQVLLRDGIQSPAAGPGMNALRRHAEELAELDPRHSADATQFGDGTFRDLARVPDGCFGARRRNRRRGRWRG